MTNFKQLKIWQNGIEIAVKIYQLVNTFPPHEKFGLSAQLYRAAVSIASNIAERCSRSSMKDYHRFLKISLGSTFEVETQLLIVQKLEYGDAELGLYILRVLDKKQKMLISYMKKIVA